MIYTEYLGFNCYLHVILVTVEGEKCCPFVQTGTHEFVTMNSLLNPYLFLWNCRFLYQEMVETKILHQFWLQANMKG